VRLRLAVGVRSGRASSSGHRCCSRRVPRTSWRGSARRAVPRAWPRARVGRRAVLVARSRGLGSLRSERRSRGGERRCRQRRRMRPRLRRRLLSRSVFGHTDSSGTSAAAAAAAAAVASVASASARHG